ncbi:MAG: hypothetical protein WCS80_04190 [Bacilli bacterium]
MEENKYDCFANVYNLIMENTIRRNKNECILSVVIKVLLLISVIYGLSAEGFLTNNITYFTILSNITIGLIFIPFLVLDIIRLKTGKDLRNKPLYIIKFMFTISIFITGIVYLSMLVPFYGFSSYFQRRGSGLFLHGITPILACVDFFLFDYRFKENRFLASFYALIPALSYVVFVIILSYGFGYRWKTYDSEGLAYYMMAPYNFINFEQKAGWFGFEMGDASVLGLGIGVFYMIIILSIVFYLFGLLFLFFKDLREKNLFRRDLQ